MDTANAESNSPIRYTPLMLMVIFGDDAYHRPPLAKDLFANRPLFEFQAGMLPASRTQFRPDSLAR